jgi:hypothetical protein
MNTTENTTNTETRELKIAKRIDAIGWALFFIMIGGIGLIPEEKVPAGIWLIGVGIIMLGNNLFRYLNKIKLVGFTLVLGIIALGLGLVEYYGIEIPVFPIILIIVGVSIILGLLSKK